MGTKEPFDRPSAQRYWKAHSRVSKGYDFAADPDGLGIVCHVGEPDWLNRYYADVQRRIFLNLLSSAPARERASALDVGCGAGRWCRILADHGFETVGIDIQDDLLGANRRRMPSITFVSAAIQDFMPRQRFDLVSSVTVLQHLPYAEQERAADQIARLVTAGAHVIALENISDSDVHVFPNSIDDWVQLFQSRGFELIRVLPYDYSPLLRVLGRMRRRGGRRTLAGETTKFALSQPTGGMLARFVKQSFRVAQRLAILVDMPTERALESRRWRLPTVHCGFLFRSRMRS